MKRRKKIVLIVSVGIVGVLAAVGWYLYQKEFVGQIQFDENFYAVALSDTDPEPFVYDKYAVTLKAYVDDKGMVNYEQMKDDHKKLDAFLIAIVQLETETFDAWNEQEKIAFWINAYNALTLKAIIDNYPIKAGIISGLVYSKNSIRQIPGVWDKLQFLVMGQKMTLNEIEHKKLRAKLNEPRIHMALVCAAMSCPQLRSEPFVGKELNDQLDDQSKVFVTHNDKFKIDTDAETVYLSSIFKWFGEDFIKSYAPEKGFASHSKAEKAVLNFASKYLMKKQAEYLREGNYTIEYLDYDWSLNEQAE